MYNDSELFRHKKSDTVKWIIVFVLIVILLAGTTASLFLTLRKEPAPEENTETEETLLDDLAVGLVDTEEAYKMPKAMSFSSKTLAAALAKGQEISVKIKAIISPYDAANQLVDYSIEWGNAPTHGAEAVTDYVTVAPDSDGSLTATVSCRQAFGDDKIIITVTTRDGGYTADCTVSFVGVASELSITPSGASSIQDDKRGAYYQLGTNKTYTIDINLDNIFHEVGSTNLTVSTGGFGSLYFGTVYVDSTTGVSRFSNMEKREMSDIAEWFIESADISGTKLTVKTGTKLVENYSSHTENDEYFTGSYIYDRFVYEDEFGLTMGQTTADDYEVKAQTNTAELPSCYFTITVTDSVSGLCDTVRFWLVSSVTGIRFEEADLSF